MAGKRQFGEVWEKTRSNGTSAWFVRYRLGGRRVCVVAGRTRKEAEAYLAARLLDVHKAALEQRDVTPATTLGEIAPRLLGIWRARLRPRTVAPRKLILERASAYFGKRPMSVVRRADVEAWCAQLALAPKTIEQHHAVLSAAWTLAIELGAATLNPCRGARRPRVDEKPVPFIAPAVLARIYAAMPEEIRPIVILIGETGLRRAEALSLVWGDVADDNSVVTIRGEVAKSHRVRRVPTTPAARAMLKALRKSRPGTADARLFGFERTAFNNAFRTAADAAGFQALTPHSLRHAFASGLVRAGVDLPSVQRLLGHASITVTMRYAGWAPADADTRAIEALARARQAVPPARKSRTSATDT
jgi:integrase